MLLKLLDILLQGREEGWMHKIMEGHNSLRKIHSDSQTQGLLHLQLHIKWAKLSYHATLSSSNYKWNEVQS